MTNKNKFRGMKYKDTQGNKVLGDFADEGQEDIIPKEKAKKIIRGE